MPRTAEHNASDPFRDLVEQSPVAMLVQREGRLCYANRAARQLFGAGDDAALFAKPLPELLHPCQPPGSVEVSGTDAAEQPEDAPSMHRVIALDGREFDVLTSKREIAYAGAQALLICCQDFSAQHQAAVQLDQQGRFLQVLIETIPLPVFHKDLAGVYAGCNQAFEEVVGIERSRIIGKSSREVYAAKFTEPHQRVDRELLAAGGRRIYETDFERADGVIRRMIVHKAAITDQYGEINGLVGVMVDISELRQFEQALMESEQNYRSLSTEFQVILEGIPDSLTLWDEERRVSWTNHNARKFFLAEPARVIGKTCRELCLLADDIDSCVVASCFDSGRQQELVSRAQDGRTWSLKAFPIRNERETVDKVLTLATDITESLRLREEAQRSAHLAALGELSAGIAHEINNPTGLILLNMSLLQDVLTDLLPKLFDGRVPLPAAFKPGGLPLERLREELPDVVEEIIDSAQRIKHIVEDLKDFARLQDPSRFEQVDLNEVVAKALRLLNNAIRKATDNFVVDYAAELPPVYGVAQRLEQVVINIILNACQALASRADNITVAVYHDADRGVNLIRVWDEGRGIDPQLLSQVTDPFFTTKREQGGTGLGLSVSSRIMDEHNGHLVIDSKPGQGTTVTLELPVAGGEKP